MEHALNGNRRTERWKWLTLAAVLAVVSFGCGETESAGSSPAVDAGAGGSAGSAGSGGNSAVNGGGGAEAPNFADALGENPALFADPQRNPGDFLGLSTDATEGAQGYADAALACYSTPNACGGPD